MLRVLHLLASKMPTVLANGDGPPRRDENSLVERKQKDPRMGTSGGVCAIFDLDGTLTKPRQVSLRPAWLSVILSNPALLASSFFGYDRDLA